MDLYWRGLMRDDLVVIIDSGIDVKNPQIMSHVEGGCNLIYDDGLISSDDNIDDNHGHGTNCADLILRLNKKVHFWIIKIVNEDGLSYSELMLEALKRCLKIPARIICMSLSITTQTCEYEKSLYQICKRLNQQGKFICISENNEMEHSQPAKFNQVIGVKAYYGGRKNAWMINEQEDVQVITDGNPVFIMGKKGGFNFFKGCSKANAFFAAVVYQYQQSEDLKNMDTALERIKKDSRYDERYQGNEEFGIGKEPESEKERQLEKIIQKSIFEVSGCQPEINLLRKAPIMSRITGISYYNFYELIKIIYHELGISEDDFHNIEANNVCTLYRLRKFLREKLEDEEKK